ncbi:MAG TPA: tRNA-dihydrouridine synthase family protein [Fimbriimonadaceae bacterium]|nr:tRNA-dihydrouridine synthase family protein [Fimbriimonadaceae bacterium]
MICKGVPSLALAPMDGITDAPMRELQGEIGAFSYAVTEFIRVSGATVPAKVFRREVPELSSGAKTRSGLSVQVQILGGEPEWMAATAVEVWRAGATAVDLNFGCPAPTVNRHDGGATLLQFPERIEEIVNAVRQALPPEVPVSAKLRLGWECIDDIYRNAEAATRGGANWLTIHARTKSQGYKPPVFWQPIGRVREQLNIPVVANGDIWTIDDFLRCQEETGCEHYMLGRSALANPQLGRQIAGALGMRMVRTSVPTDLHALLSRLDSLTCEYFGPSVSRSPARLKQWLKLAANFGSFTQFDLVKRAETSAELLELLQNTAIEAA